MRTALALLALASPCVAADFPRFTAQEIDAHAGEVVYAVTVADVNGDKKPDVVAVTEDSVLWYENPSWAKHTIIKGKTERDNVCLQAHDIDGDGKIDFALGAGWHPADTNKASTLQWLGRDAKGEWQVHPIKYDEPTLHRIRWGAVSRRGKAQLVTVPLQGRGTKGPNWGEGSGVKVQVFSIPDEPTSPDWPSVVADDSLHTTHNLQIAYIKGDHYDDILIAGWEGVFVLSNKFSGKWSREQIGAGNQDSKPFKGASEVKMGTISERLGDAGGGPYIATIEPWHGHQVVVYAGSPMKRTVIAEPVTWGHAVWCSDLDGDGDDELIIGQRDPNKDDLKGPKGPGVFVFTPTFDSKTKELSFTRHTIDDGGMACEDALATDLDGDGKPEIIAGGRATHNVKIYWNKGTTR
ncbi:MAG: repeat protein [Planctomycetota bacterium]|nr:repeat protein [Planctomycetota bacterium]